ncbi:MAG TPA: helix-turn-helix transcriptional regulator [Fimbriimonas sp.]|nr:helix-turn-helix transcriptional regulator [Fimbriimonas sp.]
MLNRSGTHIASGTAELDVRERLIEAKQHLASHFGDDIQLADVARQAGYSPCHFQRLFRREFGESPMAFRRRLRLSKARSLLQQTSQEVAEIAFLVGYNSPETFIKLFKSRYGITPMTFRQLSNNGGGHAIIPSCFLHNRKIE